MQCHEIRKKYSKIGECSNQKVFVIDNKWKASARIVKIFGLTLYETYYKNALGF